MYTLNVAHILSQISFYQENYLSILADPLQYYIPVEEAVIEVWPFKAQQLYLGDLLQLWFAEKWKNQVSPTFQFEIFLNANQNSERSDQYIFAIQANVLTGKNKSQVWDRNEKKTKFVELVQPRKHFFEYKALTQPKKSQILLNKQINLV